MKVLIAEDDPMVTKLYQAKFGLEGFETVHASNGEEALEKLPEKPDIILLDLMMPIMDGFEFLEKIKEKPEYKNIPIIVLSILGQDVDIQRAKKLGAVDYLVKSDMTPKQVVDKIREHLPK